MPMQLVTTAKTGPRGGKASKPSPEGLLAAARQLREEFDLRSAVQKGRMDMQDLWLLWYLLVDQRQSLQPANRSRYYSPRIQSIADTARRVLGTNPVRYRAVMPQLDRTVDDSQSVRTLENVLHGLLYDVDRQLTSRGEMDARMQAAFHMLVRGQWAYKLHMTNAAKTSTGSPVHYQQLDPRQLLPAFDMMGQESVVGFDTVTIGQLYYQYPEELKGLVNRAKNIVTNSGVVDYTFMHTPLLELEWSSREEHGLLLDVSGMPEDISEGLNISDTEHSSARYIWLKEPWTHGYDRSLIQTGNVNGVPAGLHSQESTVQYREHSALNKMPIHRGGDSVGEMATSVLFMPNGNQVALNAGTVDPTGALMGRSIFSGISHMIPEFNELMSLLKDAVIQEIRGTWTLKTRTGELVNLSLGTGKINPLTLQDSLEKISPDIQTPDVLQVLQIMSQEISDASIDLRAILSADFEGSGHLRARMEQAALTALADYKLGMGQWATSIADSFVTQYRAAPDAFSDWKIRGRSPGMATSFFVVDLNDEVNEALTGEAEPPVIEASIKVAMPVDMMARINMAKSAIDPNNPVMSLIQALDLIMEVDDSEGAYDSILEDIGNRNPTIQLAKIAAAFRRKGAPELADMIMGDQFRGAFMNDVQQGATSTPGGAAKGTPASTLPPEVTTGGGGEPTR